MEIKTRKPTRLPNYDYSNYGYYFITICTAKKQKVLGTVVTLITNSNKLNNQVGEGLRALPLCDAPETVLTNIGKAVEKSLDYINENYSNAKIEKYVIMPNHIHFIVKISGGHGGPPLQSIIGRMKSYTTTIYGKTLWQRSFYDHIIRDENDYLKIWNYIDTNPHKWTEDKYYI